MKELMQRKTKRPTFQAALCLAAMALCLCLPACQGKKSNTPPGQAGKQPANLPAKAAPAFNADSAYRFAAEQVAFGPRIPNSEAQRQCARYLEGKLASYGAVVQVQEFQSRRWDGTLLDGYNIIASFNPSQTQRILLCAHWDSRPYADSDCVTLKKERRLSDWAYLQLTRQIGVQLYGNDRPDDIAFLQMFLLNKSGYKARLAKIDNHLKLLVAPAGTVYGTPYLRINGDKYYVYEPDPDASMRIYTYKQDFADAKNLVCLNIESIPAFDVQEEMRTFASADGSVKVQTAVNKNLMDFYRDYPQCDVVIHYKAPMSDELRAAVYPQLKAAIEGKSQLEAANILLSFVQTGFQYMTDGEQFGYEKPFFPDETFYYPYCDCEDRAMLYSTLVKELLGLETILLDYPNHIASAVRFTEDVPGDAVVLDDGTRYVVCDPTYIGAPVGSCMEQYKAVGPQVIF